MATVNKASLRSEFEALKARCQMCTESRSLFEALLMLFELLLAVLLEKNTPKGSHNSGLPSSQTDVDETARGREGAKGKGPQLRAARGGPNRRVIKTRTPRLP